MDYDYTYNYDTSMGDPATTAAGFALIGTFFLFLVIISIIAYVVNAFLLGRIFKKAGVEQWAAWMPIYNIWKLLEIGGQQGFWAVLMLLPFVNIVAAVFMYIAMYRIGKSLGKEDWFILLAIFIPVVWLIWLAFDDSKWQGKKAPAKKSAATVKA